MLTTAGLDGGYAEMLIGLCQNVRAGYAAPAAEAVTGRVSRSLAEFAEATAEAWPAFLTTNTPCSFRADLREKAIGRRI
jgi:hypothetical protein